MISFTCFTFFILLHTLFTLLEAYFAWFEAFFYQCCQVSSIFALLAVAALPSQLFIISALEKALAYLNHKELPASWKREDLLGVPETPPKQSESAAADADLVSHVSLDQFTCHCFTFSHFA